MVTEWEPALGLEGLGVCGDVDDGTGSDVSVHEPHVFYHFSAKPQGPAHRGTSNTLDLPKASTVHASPRARSHLLRLMGRYR